MENKEDEELPRIRFGNHIFIVDTFNSVFIDSTNKNNKIGYDKMIGKNGARELIYNPNTRNSFDFQSYDKATYPPDILIIKISEPHVLDPVAAARLAGLPDDHLLITKLFPDTRNTVINPSIIKGEGNKIPKNLRMDMALLNNKKTKKKIKRGL